jgi:ATP-dependent Lon protease
MRKRTNKKIYEDDDEDEDDEDDEDDKYISKYKKTKKDFIYNITDYNYIKNIKQINKQAYKNFIESNEEIIKLEPTLIKIFNEQLLIKDRANLLEVYKVYNSSDPYTEEWINLKTTFNTLFTQYQNKYKEYCIYTEKQHQDMNKQIEILDSCNCVNENLFYKILQLETNIENKQIIYGRYNEFISMVCNNEEKGKLKNWLNWTVSLPHDKIKTFPFSNSELTKFLVDLSYALDKELYGMKRVKEQIILFVSSKIQNPSMKKCSLGLIGPPGTGKTAISRLLANLLQFPFEQISLGGISNPDFLKGHQYTYIGAQPGEISKCLKRMKYKNGILFLDEFDKISEDKDICSSLLHITDPIQNSEFRDNFFSEITIDLSCIWFIYSMNELPTDSALKDRIYTIEVPGYEFEDKILIVIDYLFPKALKNINTPIDSLKISKNTTKYFIEKISSKEEKGIRTLEKNVNNIVTKLDFIIKHQDKTGNLKGLNMSFNIGKFVKYPITLTEQLIDILIN